MARRERIAIIGLGTVGTAIGLGLKRAKLNNIEIVGHDSDGDAAGRAKRRGAVDNTEWNLPATVDGAGLVVLALPHDAIEPTVRNVAPVLGPGTVLTDTALVKRKLLHLIPDLLPDGVSFVSGNPILRWEDTAPGVREATTAGATYCLMPLRATRQEAVETTVGFVGAIGAHPLFVDPLEHDAYMAATVQVPELLSVALLGALSASPSWREMRRLAGDVLVQTTRSLAGAPTGAAELSANHAAAARWIDQVIIELRRFGELAQSDPGAFDQQVATLGVIHRRLLVRDTEDTGDVREPIPNIKEEMGRAFFGGKIIDAAKRAVQDKKP